MSTASLIILAFLAVGLLLIGAALRENSRSFEDGSFLPQLTMGIVGLVLVAGSILAVFIKALVA